MIACQNYELGPNGGYRVIDGYERFNGMTKPSEATYYTISVQLLGTVNVGDVISGTAETVLLDETDLSDSTVLSGDQTEVASGTVIAVKEDELALIKVTGTFVEGALRVGGEFVGACFGAQSLNAAQSYSDYQDYIAAATEAYRADITPVPGSGQIRGVWSYKGNVYAFRDNAAGTECVMHKATTSGWTTVTTPTLDPGGDYKFVNYNFTGAADGLKMYGVDGVNKAFEFDGTTLTQITVSGLTIFPTHLAAHYNHLFLAVEGSIIHSSIGDPTTFSAYTGAAELGMGDAITGLLPTPGGTMLVLTRSNVKALFGSSASDWQLKNVSNEYGGFSGSIQGTLAPTFLSDLGITILSTTEKFGDFNSDVISKPVQKEVAAMKSTIISSVTVSNKQQYRLFAESGESVIATFDGAQLRGFTYSAYPIPVRCISAAKRNDNFGSSALSGPDDIFFGSDDGYIYQMDSGTSFDGEPLVAIFRTPYFHLGSPHQKKRWRKLTLDIDTEGGEESSLYVKPDYALFRPKFPIASESEVTTDISGGYYNLDNWDEIFWSTEDADKFYPIHLRGTSPGISLTIWSQNTHKAPHTIRSATLRYAPRGELR